MFKKKTKLEKPLDTYPIVLGPFISVTQNTPSLINQLELCICAALVRVACQSCLSVCLLDGLLIGVTSDTQRLIVLLLCCLLHN